MMLFLARYMEYLYEYKKGVGFWEYYLTNTI